MLPYCGRSAIAGPVGMVARRTQQVCEHNGAFVIEGYSSLMSIGMRIGIVMTLRL